MVTTLGSLSSEVLLRILGNLDDARDVVRFRQSSRRMYNVAGDALLWRDLYVYTFLKTSTRGAVEAERPSKRRKFSSTGEVSEENAFTPARSIKGLPMMRRLTSNNSSTDTTDEEDRRVDWYTLFKVSSNWQTGNFSTRQLQILQEEGKVPLSTEAGPSRLPELSRSGAEMAATTRTLIDSTQTHIFTTTQAKDDIDNLPTLLVFPSKGLEGVSTRNDVSQESLARHRSMKFANRKGKSIHITALAVDKRETEKTSARLFLGYSNGDSSLVYYNKVANTFHDEQFIEENALQAIVSAVLSTPILVTCTADFKLRIYRTAKDSTKLMEERRTYSCHWPASLHLEPLRKKDDENQPYRLSIAYSSPIYPIGWTVGLQEIIIGPRSSLSSRSASARRTHVVTRIDSPSKEDRRKLISGLSLRDEERRRKVGRLTSLSYEDPFIVVGTEDNDVVCFRVSGSTKSNDDIPLLSPLSLNHVSSFQGHTGTVHSVSLNDGRCVTGGSDGSVRLWKLGDEEEAVAKAAGLLTTIDASLRRGLGKVVTIGTSFGGKRKRFETTVAGDMSNRSSGGGGPLSLADILREAQSGNSNNTPSSSSSAVVRWVTSAFDQIISISAVKRAATLQNSVGTCRSEAAFLEKEEEQVQIWNFSR